MKDHKVVAMPREYLGRQVNIQDFVVVQNSKTPTYRRPVTTSTGRQGRTVNRRSKSPGKGSVSRSRDIVQEVYDRMGVNYVRGQNSIELYDNNSSISINSETKKVIQSASRYGSNASNASNATHCAPVRGTKKESEVIAQRSGFSSFHQKCQSLSVDTRNDQEERIDRGNNIVQDEERNERHSTRSTRSIKSMISTFGGGKSVASRNSSYRLESPSSRKNSYKSPPKYVHASTPPNNDSDKIIDFRNDNNMDANMSIVSLDESQCRQQASRHEEIPSRRASFQTSTTNSKVANSFLAAISSPTTGNTQATSKTSNGHSLAIFTSSTKNANVPIEILQSESPNSNCNNGINHETIDKIIEEKLQAKLTVLNASFEEKLRRVDVDTKARMEEMETKLKKVFIEQSERKKPEDQINYHHNRSR